MRVGRGPLQFSISVMGGPYSDVRGPREERIADVRCGARVNHEISDLQPQTEYTIAVSLISAVDGRALLRESLEARTSDATTALFAGEEWGRTGKGGKDGYKEGDYMTEPDKQGAKGTVESSGGASSSTSSPGASSSADPLPAAPQAPNRQNSQDDVSTNAPSEAGEDEERRPDENASDWGSEVEVTLAPESNAQLEPGAIPQERESASSSVPPPSGPTDDGEVIVQDIGDVTTVINVINVSDKRGSRECKLCNMLDCLKINRSSADADDIVIERQVAPKPAPKRSFRPYRMPFPGTPVDPTTVGRARGPGDIQV